MPAIAGILALLVALCLHPSQKTFVSADGVVQGQFTSTGAGDVSSAWQKFQSWKNYMESADRGNQGNRKARFGSQHVHYHFHNSGGDNKAVAQPQSCVCPKCAELPPQPHVYAGLQDSTLKVTAPTVAATPVTMDGEQLIMVLPTNDEFVGSEILREKRPYEQHVLRRMLAYIRPGSRVVDAGANLGTYSIFFASKVGPQGEVWAFEPQEYMQQVLTTNVVINGFRNVRILNKGLSFEPGLAQMSARLPDGQHGGKNFDEVHQSQQAVNYGGRPIGTGGESIQLITLDSLELTDVSFIKLDIQGAEPLAIYGARKTIERNLPVLSFEWSDQFLVTQEMIDSLKIPPEVATFNHKTYLQGLNYTLAYKQVAQISQDEWWVPPGYPAVHGA